MQLAPKKPIPARTTVPAIVIGDDPINFLGIARNLGRLGVPVYRIGTTDNKILRSKYVVQHFINEAIEKNSDAEFVECIEKARSMIGQAPVLFPASDIHVLRVARNLEQLRASCLPVAASLDVAELLVSKRAFYQSLASFGMAHPKSAYPDSIDSFVAAANDIGYPVFLKPDISPLFAVQFNCKGFVAHSDAELVEHLEILKQTGLETLVQEIIPGDARHMYGCAGVRTASEVIVFCYRRVREYPPGFGCGSVLESVPSFVDKTGLLGFLEHIGYEGIFDAEFKLDPRDSQFKSIEINARSWWQNTHPSASGINIIQGAYNFALGRRLPEQSYKTGCEWMHLVNDYSARKEQGIGLRDWLTSVRRASAFDIWSSDDVMPGVIHYFRLVLGKMRNLFRS